MHMLKGGQCSALAMVVAGAVAGAVAGVSTGAAQAQQAGLLEEVIVTAQKRAQNVQDVPVSVATLSGEKLDVLGSAGADIRFLSARIPSLQIESSFGRTFPRFYIRGLGNSDFDLNASQPVSLIYDEVVLENPILKGFPVFDLERIEVLRGPQGTLFGRNTPAGIVKFDSRKPSHETDGYVSLSYGRFNQVDFEGAVGGSIIEDVLSARVSVLYQHRDDWVDNVQNGPGDDLEGYDEFAGRLQLLFEPTDRFSALLNVHGRKLDGTARVFRANIVEPGTDNIVQPVPGTGTIVGVPPFGTTLINPEFQDFERDTVFHDGVNTQDLNEIGAIAKLEYDLGQVTLTSITAYESAELFTRGDIDGGFGSLIGQGFGPDPFNVNTVGPGNIPFDAQTADSLPRHRQITEEFRVSSNELGRFDFQAGFFYFSEELTIDTLNFDSLAPGQPQNGFSTQSQDTTAWAIFVSVDIEVTDDLTVQGGVRYSEDERDLVAERPDPVLFGDLVIPPSTAEADDEVVSWDVSARYAVNDDVNVYGRIARSFRAPSIQGRVLFAPFDGTPETNGISVGDTETILSFEAGFKAELFDNRARLNAAAFYYEVDNQQLSAVGGAANIAQLVNADETIGWGFEADLEAAVTENLLVTAGLSYNNTEIQDEDLQVAVCAGGCTVLDPPGTTPGTAFIDGNRLPQSPRWIFNVTARYSYPIGVGGELFVFTDWAYRSRVNFFLYDSAEFQDSKLIEGGLRIGYLHNDGRYEIAAFGRNITNDVSRTGGIDFNNLTGFVNEPPVWGIEASYRF